MVARRRQAQHVQSAAARKDALSTVDGPEQCGLRGAFRQPSSVQPDIEGAQQCDQQSDYRSQALDAAPKLQNFRLKSHLAHVQDIRRDDGPVLTV